MVSMRSASAARSWSSSSEKNGTSVRISGSAPTRADYRTGTTAGRVIEMARPAMNAGPAPRLLRFVRAVGRIAAARPWLPLCLMAAAPFLPGLFEFARKGVPDILFDGDGGALELRAWQAAHGVQFVGPYSRF